VSGETKRFAREAAQELEALGHTAFSKRFRDDRTSLFRRSESGSEYEIVVEWSETRDGRIDVVVTAEDVTVAQPAVESESFVLPPPA
jgi:hypothetical protein